MDNILKIIAALTQLMGLVPAGTVWWNDLKARHDRLEALKAQGDGAKWTDEQWSQALAEDAALDARIDANAVRAQQAIDDGSAS